MLRPQDDIYVTLPSNVPGVPGNKPSNYKTVLPTPLKLSGAWEVAMLETHYPHQIPNFKATTLVVIATETAQSEQLKPPHYLPQAPMPKPYWQQPQAYQSPRGQAHRDEIDGFWPSGEDDEELNTDQNDRGPHTAPKPQTAAESTPAKGNDKKSEQPIDLDDPEPAKKETPAVDKPEDAKKPEVKKPEDARTKKSTCENPSPCRSWRRRASECSWRYTVPSSESV